MGIAAVELVSICFCLPNGRVCKGRYNLCYQIRYVWLHSVGVSLNTGVMLNLSV